MGDALEVLRVNSVLESEPGTGHADRGGGDGRGKGDGDDSSELHGEAVKEWGVLRW